MKALEELISICARERKSPEAVLGLPDTGYCPATSHPLADIQNRAKERLPKAIEKLIRYNGQDCAGLVSRIYACEISDQSPSPLHGFPGMDLLKEMWEGGISLSWLCLGAGEPARELPSAKMVQDSSAFEIRKDMPVAEKFWWRNATNDKVRLITVAIQHLLWHLPRIKIEPAMPEYREMRERVMDKIWSIKGDMEPGIAEAVELIREDPARCGLLFLISRSRLSDLKSKKPKLPRQRLYYLYEAILSRYEKEGILLILRGLDGLAKRLGFTGLAEVLKKGTWASKRIG